MEQMTTLRDLVDQVIQKKEEEKRIAEEQAAEDQYWKIPICYDDDEDNTIAITPVLPIEEPDNSLIKSEGIPDNVCDVPLCNNPTSLEAFKEHSETIIDYNDDSTSSDDDSYENIDYVDASPPDVEIVSLEVVEIVDPEVGRIDDDILLTIKDDILLVIKSTSTFPNLFLEEANTFDNSIPNPETFRFNLVRGIKRSSGSTTTHVDFSQYDSFIFDLSNDQFPPADRSDFNHEEFADELTHIMSLPNLECFKFKIDPDPGDLTSIDLGIHSSVNCPPPYLLSTRNEDTIFDPGISMYHSFMPDVSHRSGTFMKFNVYPNHLKWESADFPDCEDSLACSIHMSFTSSASVWESSEEDSTNLRLADKQSGRPSGSLPSNTKPNPKGHNSKAYQPPQSRNEHVNVVFTRSGNSYNLPVNPNDQQNDYETPINCDSDDEDEEPTP
ncbi:hypothetical protein Tco_1191957 [Tanacetum coccineum]